MMSYVHLHPYPFLLPHQQKIRKKPIKTRCAITGVRNGRPFSSSVITPVVKYVPLRQCDILNRDRDDGCHMWEAGTVYPSGRPEFTPGV